MSVNVLKSEKVNKEEQTTNVIIDQFRETCIQLKAMGKTRKDVIESVNYTIKQQSNAIKEIFQEDDAHSQIDLKRIMSGNFMEDYQDFIDHLCLMETVDLPEYKEVQQKIVKQEHQLQKELPDEIFKKVIQVVDDGSYLESIAKEYFFQKGFRDGISFVITSFFKV
jgi:hypothetical protein